MARSHAIWLLISRKNETIPAVPVAAFTVKHELQTWLDRNRWQWDQLRLYYMKDGPRAIPGYPDTAPEERDIWELMK